MIISVAHAPFQFSYHPAYDLKLGDHVFPSTKFEQIKLELERHGILTPHNLIDPRPATSDQLILVHSPAWVSALIDGTIGYEQILKLEIPYSQPMVRAFLYHAGGSIAAAQAALKDGAAFNIGGGFHHAFSAHGEGFCAIHDVAIAIRVLQQTGQIRTAMIIDTDVHQGNGTAHIFSNDPTVFTLSIHQRNNYPYDKQSSDLDIEIEDRIRDADYLAALSQGLSHAFSKMQPDLIAYIAGTDPYHDDKLGGLHLTIAGMMERDLLVLGQARQRAIPVFVTLAGGYAKKIEDTVTLHTNTARALAATMAK